jgi:hypothetical protein
MIDSQCPKAPIGFVFGKEVTLTDLQYRIQWETWAYNLQVSLNHYAHAQGHALAKAAYTQKFQARINERISIFDPIQ